VGVELLRGKGVIRLSNWSMTSQNRLLSRLLFIRDGVFITVTGRNFLIKRTNRITEKLFLGATTFHHQKMTYCCHLWPKLTRRHLKKRSAGTCPVLCAYSIFCQKIRFFFFPEKNVYF